MNGARRVQSKDDESPPLPITRGARISLTWLAPLIAIGIAAFLVYRSLPASGLEITLHADDGSGIVPNSTLIQYRGVRVGIVRSVTLKENLAGVVIHATLEQSADAVAREGSRFWVVRPRISLAEVRGLDTIVSGPYITLRPGYGEVQTTFDVLDSPPVADYPEQGLRVRLSTRRLGSLKPGTAILYRDVAIGEVYDYHLAEDARAVRLYAYIEEPYKNLIRSNSVFWNASGFDLNVSLFGAKITTESIKGILTGGIAVATPEEPGPPAVDDALFLPKDEQQENWLEWSPYIKLPVKKMKKETAVSASKPESEIRIEKPVEKP